MLKEREKWIKELDNKLSYVQLGFGDIPIIKNKVNGKQVKNLSYYEQDRYGNFKYNRTGFLNKKQHIIPILKYNLDPKNFEVSASSKDLDDRLKNQVKKAKPMMKKFERDFIKGFEDYDCSIVFIQKDWDIEPLYMQDDNVISLYIHLFFGVALINYL